MRALGLALLALIAAGLLAAACSSSDEAADWRTDWETLPGFTLEIDTEGYQLPTAIAFVPNPDPAPDAVLYFVAELRGTIKAITNSREILEFAAVPAFDPPDRDLPEPGAQGGLGGLCLDPAHGYVFATYTTAREGGGLTNHIVRYSTVPEVFGAVPAAPTNVGAFLEVERSSTAHQVGGCWVQGDSVFIGVGDAFRAPTARQIDRLLGKVVRMTLDGEPHPDNPFLDHESLNLGADARYVYAYGLRNPFGITVVDGVPFVAENGPDIDRFVRIDAGRDYLYDGTDLSTGAAADAVFSPVIAPVQIDHSSHAVTALPEIYTDHFFIAAAADEGFPGRSGVLALGYDLAAGVVDQRPEYLVRYRGSSAPAVVGLALGPDGLYFSHLLPDSEGQTRILRLRQDPTAEHPYLIGGRGGLFVAQGCSGCHQRGGQGGTIGPSLDFDAERFTLLNDRISSAQYEALLAELDLSTDEPFASTADARAEVRDASGRSRVELWVTNRILEPRFDDPTAQMPNLGLTRDEAEALTSELLVLRRPRQEGRVERLATTIRDKMPFFPNTRGGDMMAGVFLGGVLGALGVAFLVVVTVLVRAWVRRRRLRV